ncbi:MAG: peroxiredoxin-like family protein [Myxococcaceae bacterium]|nr:peroxiredoxin-like family protein [Myxococcaceae bacterium]
MFCREQVAGFRSRADELKALGVKLFFIGNGTPTMAKDFRAFMQMGELPVWTDPKRQTYAHLGFKRGWLSVLSPAVWKYGARAAAAGFRQGKTAGDPVQQGGVLVVKKGGELVYGFASATAGDHPPIDEVMAKARLAAQA